MDSEQQARVLLLGGVVAIIVLALALVAFGWYWTERRPLGRTVLKVEETTVSFSSMKRRMSYELFQNTQLQQNPTALPAIAYANLLEELIVLARADEAGVTVDQAKIDADLNTRIGVAEGADRRTFQDRLRNQLDATGLNETEFRRLVQAATVQTALKDKLTTEVPANVVQAKVEVINTETAEIAQQAIDRINAGEAFADVAKELSLDPNVQTDGGMSDFEAEGSFPEAYNDFAFSAEPGTLSGPLNVEGAINYYVVRVVERSEQPVREEQRPTLGTLKYSEWLTSTQDEMEGSGAIVNKFEQDDQDEALASVLDDALPRIIAQYTAQAEAQAAQQTAAALATLNPVATSTPVAAETPAAAATETGAGPSPPAQPVAPSQP